MTESTVTTAPNSSTTAAARKAAERTAKAVVDAAPTVVETVEVVTELPSRLVVNQKLVVGVSVLVGTALGAAGFWGVNKFRNRNKVTIEVPDGVDAEDAKTSHEN